LYPNLRRNAAASGKPFRLITGYREYRLFFFFVNNNFMETIKTGVFQPSPRASFPFAFNARLCRLRRVFRKKNEKIAKKQRFGGRNTGIFRIFIR
jgi:hypothetical protein